MQPQSPVYSSPIKLDLRNRKLHLFLETKRTEQLKDQKKIHDSSGSVAKDLGYAF